MTIMIRTTKRNRIAKGSSFQTADVVATHLDALNVNRILVSVFAHLVSGQLNAFR